MGKQPRIIPQVGDSIQSCCNVLIQISNVKQNVIRHSKKEESVTDRKKRQMTETAYKRAQRSDLLDKVFRGAIINILRG